MKKNYMKRNLMLLGAAAVVASASAAGSYHDVTLKYMTDPAFIAGWQGALTATADGVAEVYNGAFNLYQTLSDMPAGEYTLKVNAFYRCGYNDFAKEKMAGGDHHYAFIYINETRTPVEGLFDNGREVAPNSTYEANEQFALGEYENVVTVNHPGGDLVVGICNTGGWQDEWCCFDNFRLFKGDEDITSQLENPDFSSTLNVASEAWNNANSAGEVKNPDANKGGGVYRKTNASPYHFAQQVELPAGKYRFSALTFHRYGGAGNYKGQIITCKGDWALNETKSPKDWFDANEYETNTSYAHAYIYMSKAEAKPVNIKLQVVGKDNCASTRIKDCWELCNGDYDNMPDNETRGTADGVQIVPEYENTFCVVDAWGDSGNERESAVAFVNEPEKYRQYVEFELTETTTVWLGMGKDSNSGDQYWHPFADFKLEAFVEDAPVELQGSGTEADPYLIGTAADLCAAHLYIDQESDQPRVYFKQTADIDMAGVKEYNSFVGWYGGGKDGAYHGEFSYDGDYHVIRNFAPDDTAESRLYDADNKGYDGGYYDISIFGLLRGEVKNLGVIDAKSISNTDRNFESSGILGGYMGNGSIGATVSNVFVTGEASSNKRAGGVFGNGGVNSTLTDVYADVTVSTGVDGKPLGGFVGHLNGKTLTLDGGYIRATLSGSTAAGLLVSSENTGTVEVTSSGFVVIGEGDLVASGVTLTGDNNVKKFAEATEEAISEIQFMKSFSEEKMLNGMPTFNWMTDDQISGVDNVVADEVEANAAVEYYNLQGVRVENPTTGLYIKKQGNVVSKVVIR